MRTTPQDARTIIASLTALLALSTPPYVILIVMAIFVCCMEYKYRRTSAAMGTEIVPTRRDLPK